MCRSQFAGVNVQAFSSWDPLITPFNIHRDDGQATPTMDGYSQRWVALNVPTRRTYTVEYPSRAALGVRIDVRSPRRRRVGAPDAAVHVPRSS